MFNKLTIMFNNVHKDRPGQGVQAESDLGGADGRAGQAVASFLFLPY